MYRGNFIAGWRDWNYEYYVGDRDTTHTGNRDSRGGWCQTAGYSRTVFNRMSHHQYPGWVDGCVVGNRAGSGDCVLRALDNDCFDKSNHHGIWDFRGGGNYFWNVSRAQSRRYGPR